MANHTGPKDTGMVVYETPAYGALHPSTSQSHEDSTIRDHNPHGNGQLPLYSKNRPDTWNSIIELATTLDVKGGPPLPIHEYPRGPIASRFRSANDEQLLIKRRIVDSFFVAIRSGNVELVASFWGSNLVTTETTAWGGKTPLLAAVEAGHTHMVRYLLDVKADINTSGVTETTISEPMRFRKRKELHTYRTPLQYAAQTGNLAVVKLLMERGADDASVAPDGQLALRLAASNGHREIVEYLPSRRGGGFRRWKAKHAKATSRAKEAMHSMYVFGKFFVWDIPRFFLWTIPKHTIVLPLIKGMKWLHQHRHQIPKLIADAANVMAIRMRKFGPQAWRILKELPGGIWSFVKDLAKYIWRSIKRLPNGLKIALVWLWGGIKHTGLAIGHFISRLFSFIHTIYAAIGSSFQRITLRDVSNAFVSCLHALFVNAPKKIWQWLCTLGQVSLRVLKAIFGCWGECLWALICCCIAVFTYIPEKIWEMLLACGGSARSGGKEVMVWIDPKRV